MILRFRRQWDQSPARPGMISAMRTYDVVATIDGVGPIIKITRSEGTISANGEKIANVTAQRDETVQGIRLKIIGLHVGPVASAVGQGDGG